MPGKIFVNYRRDDARDMAARIRDRLAATFGDAHVFMDVDNLLAGQRFDKELEKALGQTDVFVAVIGPRWLELLAERQASGERDYVREEIAGALQRGIVVIPVLIERTPLPRADALPQDIRDVVLHQKHVVTHEQFGRDVTGLVEAIRFGRKAARADAVGGRKAALLWAGAAVLSLLVLGAGVLAYQMAANDRGAVVKLLEDRGAEAKLDAERARQDEIKRAAEAAATKKADEEAQRKRAAEEAERQRLAMFKAEQDRIEEDRKRQASDALKRAADAAAAAQKKADEEAQAKKVAKESEQERVESARRQVELEMWRPGRAFRDCAVCPEMVVVPPGSFIMGAPSDEAERDLDEGPMRQVTFARPFAVGKYEVTAAEWDACVKAGGCNATLEAGIGKQPATVEWNDIMEYLPWLNRRTGKAYRLLSEAEWEYAARAGTTTRFSTGNTITTKQANFDRTLGKAVAVGSFPANAFGLHDMHGNVREFVQDCYKKNYVGAPSDGSAVPDFSDCDRVLRGGAWVDPAKELRSAFRLGMQEKSIEQLFGRMLGKQGFRVALSLK